MSRASAQFVGSSRSPRGAEVLPLPKRHEPAQRAAAAAADDDEHDGPRPPGDEDEGEPEFAALANGAEFDFDSEAAADAACATTGAPQTRAAGGLETAADDAALCAWIARIARQDERALEALYDATSARVLGVVLRITHRHALAEEVLEETFWQVWRQAPRFDLGRGRPITWLLAMARSRAIDALRREQRFQHEELPNDDGAEAVDGGGSHQPAAQDLLEATRGNVHVHAALASLEPRARQLVALAFFRGLTHEEIAAQQQMPLGTVKSLIRRALQQLKRVMEAEHA